MLMVLPLIKPTIREVWYSSKCLACISSVRHTPHMGSSKAHILSSHLPFRGCSSHPRALFTVLVQPIDIKYMVQLHCSTHIATSMEVKIFV